LADVHIIFTGKLGDKFVLINR